MQAEDDVAKGEQGSDLPETDDVGSSAIGGLVPDDLETERARLLADSPGGHDFANENKQRRRRHHKTMTVAGDDLQRLLSKATGW